MSESGLSGESFGFPFFFLMEAFSRSRTVLNSQILFQDSGIHYIHNSSLILLSPAVMSERRV
jgi:hypothetical protein